MFVNILYLALFHMLGFEKQSLPTFALLNIPCTTLKNTCMKKVKRRTGFAIESFSKESCDVTLKFIFILETET